MNIQSNINQALSMASLLIHMNPNIKAESERQYGLRQVSKQAEGQSKEFKEGMETLQTQSGLIAHPPSSLSKEDREKQITAFETQQDYIEDIGKRSVATAKERYDIDPSEANFEKVRHAERALEGWGTVKSAGEHLAKVARESLADTQAQKRRSRRNFLDYIKNEETSLGGKVGDLDPKIQKEIAKGYSKAQRKAIMDRKDGVSGG